MRTGISGLGSRYKNLPVENNRGSDISQIIHMERVLGKDIMHSIILVINQLGKNLFLYFSLFPILFLQILLPFFSFSRNPLVDNIQKR